MFEFLKPAFGNLSERAMAVVCVVFLLVFRGLTAPSTQSDWLVRMGFEWRIIPAMPHALGLIAAAASFLMFALTVATLCLFYPEPAPPRRAASTTTALAVFGRPFTFVDARWRPLAALAGCLAVYGIFSYAGVLVYPRVAVSMSRWIFWRATLISLAHMVDAVLVLNHAMIILIIGSWVAMFSHSSEIMMICQEWISTLLGPLRRFPLRLGTFDLTPILFFLALGFAHRLLTAWLWGAYLRTL